MKVNVTFPVAGLEQYKALRKSANVGAPGKTELRDETTFSNDATLFVDTLKAAKAELSDRLNGKGVDIAAIKTQIEQGEYEVNAQKLADSIMMLGGYVERR